MKSTARDIFKQRVFIAAGIGALLLCLTLVAIETLASKAVIEVRPLNMGSDATTGYMILVAAIASIWAFSIHVRCPDALIRKNLKVIATLIVAWLCLVMVKYLTSDAGAASLLWYAYYIPMTAIAYLCLSCSLHAATLDGFRAVIVAKRALACLGAIATILVLTNNIHHAVFEFSLENQNWESDYRYNWGYWLILGLYVSEYLAFFITLISASRAQLRKAFIPLAFIAATVGAYCLLYIIKHSLSIGTNFTLAYCVAIMIALELALDFGLLPSYTWHDEAFAMLPFDLKILDKNGSIAYRSNMAAPLNEEVAAIANKSIKGSQRETTAFRVDSHPHTIFKAYAVSGGVALLSEDASEIDRQRAILEARQRHLQRTNEMLKRKAQVTKEAHRLADEQKLFDEIEAALQEKTQRIKTLIERMPENDEPLSLSQKRKTLEEVKLLVAYCKRKGALVLAEKDDPDFNRDRLQLVFNETASDLRSIGIECAALVEISNPLPACVVSVLYDCLYDFAITAAHDEASILMFFIHESAHAIELRCTLQSESQKSAEFDHAIEKLKLSLGKRDVTHSIKRSSEQITLIVKMNASEASVTS